MKRYALFAFLFYYPSGGWDDFRGDFETSDEALKAAPKEKEAQLYQIVDTHRARVIWNGEVPYECRYQDLGGDSRPINWKRTEEPK